MPANFSSLGERLRAAGPDVSAALVVFLLGVPQCLAYATIAGLPPAMGLYAAAVPPILGSAIRSSNHVVVGPTNALSLLVGGAVLAATTHDPAQVAIALALGVAVFQIVATLLKLSAVIDFISSPTVLGYITGAGLLIGIGQLHNLTATVGPRGKIWVTVGGWIEALPQTHSLSLIFAAATVLCVIGVRLLGRAIDKKLPAALIAMVVGIVANMVFGLEARGLRVIADIEPIPPGLPPITLPSLELAWELAPFALACAVLSLVEANAVARSIAGRTGQQLDAPREFMGQGVANLAAAFTGGYPVSGSLSRSALNEQAGARSRWAAALSGVLMLLVLVTAASVLDHTPIPSLAGLLLVVAWDLVDLDRIRTIFATSKGDGLTFLVTMLGTWSLDLDKAIYVGVGLSLVLFLRKARRLSTREFLVDESGGFTLRPLDIESLGPLGTLGTGSDASVLSPVVRLFHIEGALFFGSASELRRALEAIARAPGLVVAVIRLDRAASLDLTAAEVLGTIAQSMRRRGRHLLVVGMNPLMSRTFERSGVAEAVGEAQLFPAQERPFGALEAARDRAVELVSAGSSEARPRRAEAPSELP